MSQSCRNALPVYIYVCSVLYHRLHLSAHSLEGTHILTDRLLRFEGEVIQSLLNYRGLASSFCCTPCQASNCFNRYWYVTNIVPV